MTKEPMPSQDIHEVDGANTPRAAKRRGWKVSLSLTGTALLLAGIIASVGLNLLIPKVPNHDQGFRARVAWYFEHGQSKADQQTLTAAVNFLLGKEPAVAEETHFESLPVAKNAAPEAPKS
jgi:hypothetical protein